MIPGKGLKIYRRAKRDGKNVCKAVHFERKVSYLNLLLQLTFKIKRFILIFLWLELFGARRWYDGHKIIHNSRRKSKNVERETEEGC